MTFGNTDYLYGLVLIPVFALFLWWASQQRRSALARLGDPALIGMLSRSVDWRGRRLQSTLWFIAIGLIIIGLSRPQWGTEVRAVERHGIQIMVALDVSKSMLAQDIKPNRLSRAKLEIVDLMRRLKGDEIGLVLFSGASFLQSPLTFDYATVRTFLENASPELISRPGTAIADAIDTAMAGFDEKRTSQKVIIIMTDGEDHEGDTLAAARRAVQEGAIIYTVGFGSLEGEPIPEYNARGEVAGYKQDQNGEVVLSALGEAALQEIAREANGKYYRASTGSGAAEALSEELDGLQKESVESEFETRNVERFQAFLLISLIALVVIELIPERTAAWSPLRGASLPFPRRIARRWPW